MSTREESNTSSILFQLFGVILLLVMLFTVASQASALAQHDMAIAEAARTMSGEVVAKTYTPGHGNFLASASPEAYFIEVRGTNPMTHQTETSFRTVPKDVWDRTSVGDQVQGSTAAP